MAALCRGVGDCQRGVARGGFAANDTEHRRVWRWDVLGTASGRLKTQDSRPPRRRTRLVTYGALGRRASRDDGPASADCFRTVLVTLLRDMRRRLDGRGLFPSRFSSRCYADCVSFHDTGSKSLAADVLNQRHVDPARTGRLSPARARVGSICAFPNKEASHSIDLPQP